MAQLVLEMDYKALLVPQEAQADPVPLEMMALWVLLAHLVHEELMDYLDHQVNLEDPEHQEAKDLQEDQDPLEALAHQDAQE